ncbi:MAG: sigma-70 family RNA polymerase sigma factor [candidate division WOR-3 bacterium]
MSKDEQQPTEPDTGEDRELVRRARAGDLAAFEELVRRHQRGLFSYMYRMTGNSAEAEELAQQALVKSWQALRSFRGGSSFKTWLYRIGINLALNFRSRTRPTEELSEFIPAKEADPADEFQQRRRDAAIQAALAGLPKDQRTALVLSVYEGMSYSEIGAAMGRSVRAVDSLLFRAKQNLRKLLEPARNKGIV